jgi:hypothetical protein
VGLSRQLAVRNKTRKLDCRNKWKRATSQKHGEVRSKPHDRVECSTHWVLSGENNSVLSPPRQTVYSALKPAFDGDSASETVLNSDVVHVQRCSDSPIAFTRPPMATANSVTLKTDPRDIQFSWEYRSDKTVLSRTRKQRGWRKLERNRGGQPLRFERWRVVRIPYRQFVSRRRQR